MHWQGSICFNFSLSTVEYLCIATAVVSGTFLSLEDDSSFNCHRSNNLPRYNEFNLVHLIKVARMGLWSYWQRGQRGLDHAAAAAAAIGLYTGDVQNAAYTVLPAAELYSIRWQRHDLLEQFAQNGNLAVSSAPESFYRAKHEPDKGSCSKTRNRETRTTVYLGITCNCGVGSLTIFAERCGTAVPTFTWQRDIARK